MLDYRLVLSQRRKTLSLQVRQGQIIVRAPDYVKRAQVDDIVRAKSAWLRAKIAEQSLDETVQVAPYSSGCAIWCRGVQKNLKVSRQVIAEVVVLGNQLNVAIAESFIARHKGAAQDKITGQVKKQLEAWFKQQANDYILPRLVALSEQVNLAYRGVKIRQYKARWGSCNNRGELSFNYLLMMAPDWVVDYVIIHELCHLQHLNHSVHFWHLVGSYCPRYQQAKHWLKTHQTSLIWQDSGSLLTRET